MNDNYGGWQTMVSGSSIDMSELFRLDDKIIDIRVKIGILDNERANLRQVAERLEDIDQEVESLEKELKHWERERDSLLNSA